MENLLNGEKSHEEILIKRRTLFEELRHAAAVPTLAGDLLNYGKSH
jgi:hypothetical protein